MKNQRGRIATLLLFGLSLAVAGLSIESGGIPDTKIGLSKTSVFDVADPPPVNKDISDPGEGELLLRAFQDAPPLIPHGVAEFLPITRNDNQCIDCHEVPEKEPGEPTPIPKSHFTDLRNAPAKVGEMVVGARYICVSCHLSQTSADTLVGNDFRSN